MKSKRKIRQRQKRFDNCGRIFLTTKSRIFFLLLGITFAGLITTVVTLSDHGRCCHRENPASPVGKAVEEPLHINIVTIEMNHTSKITKIVL